MYVLKLNKPVLNTFKNKCLIERHIASLVQKNGYHLNTSTSDQLNGQSQTGLSKKSLSRHPLLTSQVLFQPPSYNCLIRHSSSTVNPINENNIDFAATDTFHETSFPTSDFINSVPKVDVASTTVGNEAPTIIDGIEYIPAPPAPYESEIVPIVLNKIGEVSFDSLGLGSLYTPVGWIQNTLEMLHVSFDMPWLVAISTLTVILRMAVFPLVIKSQRAGIKMANLSPQMKIIQEKIDDARNTGNHFEAMRLNHEMSEFFKVNNFSPLSNLLPMLQAPIFISVYFGLRGCANLPVPSMMTGGMLWFPDLTLADPYCILSVITTTTLFATILLGVDNQQTMSKNVGNIVKCIPFVIFPFTLGFPSAILWYWASTNLFSLGQVAFLRIPRVSKYFGIEKKLKIVPVAKSSKHVGIKGMIKSANDLWTNTKVRQEIKDRERVDEYAFKRAGTGPLIKTYKYSPSKSKNIINVKPKVK